MMDKEGKLNFVSGHSGTNMCEIVTLLSLIPTSYLTWHTFTNLISSPSPTLSILQDLVFLILPILLATTALVDYSHIILTVMIIINVFVIAIKLHRSHIKLSSLLAALTSAGNKLYNHERRFISTFKAYILLVTSVTILAVDFPIFPRRLAKAETFGLGLMDIGVGGFVVGAGLVSALARQANYWSGHVEQAGDQVKQAADQAKQATGQAKQAGDQSKQAADQAKQATDQAKQAGDQSKQATDQSKQATDQAKQANSMAHTIKPALPLLLLGLARATVCRMLDYPVPDSEYGRDWNFFLTLATLHLIIAPLTSLCSKIRWAPLVGGIILAALHETSLHLTTLGITALDHEAPRNNFISANREGLISLPGYLALYLLASSVGRYLFSPRDRVYQWYSVILVLMSPLPLILLTLSPHHISRCLINLPYLLITLAISSCLLSSLLSVEILMVCLAELGLFKGQQQEKRQHAAYIDPPHIITVLRSYGLAHFVLSNVLTGLVNISVNTLHIPSSYALFIIITYAICVNLIISALYNRRIKMKLL